MWNHRKVNYARICRVKKSFTSFPSILSRRHLLFSIDFDWKALHKYPIVDYEREDLDVAAIFLANHAYENFALIIGELNMQFESEMETFLRDANKTAHSKGQASDGAQFREYLNVQLFNSFTTEAWQLQPIVVDRGKGRWPLLESPSLDSAESFASLPESTRKRF